MKKVFAVFCALILAPSFTANAWIGGPFSNNTYFGENGDDGVYEAVAIPFGSARNSLGIYRWGITNNFPGLDPQNTTSVTLSANGGSSTFAVPVSSNVEFSGVSHFTHTWFVTGTYYRGFCQGTVNSGLGAITCIGAAQSADGLSGISESVSSSFRATFTSKNQGVPVRRFEGQGRAATTDGSGAFLNFRFAVFGTKVANGVEYFGLVD